MYQFRDPIHGFIEVSPVELKIIDSPPFQRLRNIKQLATTYLVYHGAEHTRFGHSLGVMHLVSEAFDSALQNYKDNNNEDLFTNIRRLWYRQILRLIALVHDLGHAPFSHASEALFENGIEHEDFTKKVIMETEISEYIKQIGKQFIEDNKVGEEYDITPELIWLIYGEKKAELNENYVMPDFKFLKSFLDSELDCDKMDYLLRDSYYCGVNYGKFDIKRVISSLNVYYNKDTNVMQLAIERGGLHAFEEFVIARYFMFIQVYYHKTRRYLDRLLVDCIEKILPKGKYPNDTMQYLNWNDDVVLDKIKEKNCTSSVFELFENRIIKSCVFETSAHLNTNENMVYNLVKSQLIKSGIEIYEDSASKLAHKIPMLEEYDDDSGKGIPILNIYSGKPSSIASQSRLLQSLTTPINIKRIYVSKERSSEAKEVVRKFLNC